ncbi:MAG: regulatory protein RecX [Gammaproteobacteria bacterium]|nr:regulatory protein RecX [Gammaproteobacteria bacterium]
MGRYIIPEALTLDKQCIDAVKQAAVRLLAIREHSRTEIRRKLETWVGNQECIEQVLDGLEADNLLNDQRFTEMYIASRRRRWFGPLRIRGELQARGISSDLAACCLAGKESEFERSLRDAAARKFGADSAAGSAEWAKMARFLQYRGFSSGQIRRHLQAG